MFLVFSNLLSFSTRLELSLASRTKASTDHKKHFSSLLITITRESRCFNSFGVGKYDHAQWTTGYPLDVG